MSDNEIQEGKMEEGHRFSETIQFVSSFPFLKEPLTFKVSRQITLPRLSVVGSEMLSQ